MIRISCICLTKRKADHTMSRYTLTIEVKREVEEISAIGVWTDYSTDASIDVDWDRISVYPVFMYFA